MLELRVQVLACGGIYGEAVCAWLLEQLAHLRQRLSSTSSVHADSWASTRQLDEIDALSLVARHRVLLLTYSPLAKWQGDAATPLPGPCTRWGVLKPLF